MELPLKETTLPNGLHVRFFNRSRHYYGDFHLVKVEVCCPVPVRAEYFADSDAFQRGLRTLGDSVSYRRTMERIGIPSGAVNDVLHELVGSFERHALPYLVTPAFPRRFVAAEMLRAGRKASPVFPLQDCRP